MARRRTNLASQDYDPIECGGGGGAVAADVDSDLLRLAALGGGEPRTGQYTGTKALMLAILEDGIRSYLSPVARIRTEAEYWVSTTRQRSPFSFEVVCEILGLEPDAVRAALHRLRERNVSPRKALGRSRPNVRRTGRIMSRKRF